WWLCPDVLERLEEERGWPISRTPSLPRSHGSCWIIMVQRDDQPWPTVREAFFLPLHWQKGGGWDNRLPGQLLDLAKEMTVELEMTDYGLSLHAGIQPEPPTIPSPPAGFDFGSGAISLAGGLYLAARNGEPDPLVAASACWKKAEGVLGVDREGLKKKLKLAAAWEMKAFFVAREQLPEAQTGSGEMKILGLAQGRFRLERVIQEFVVRQKAEPEAPN